MTDVVGPGGEPGVRDVVSVIPLLPAWRLDRPFSYLVPARLSTTTSVGSLVRIPLGGRRVRGIVVRREPSPEERDLLEVAAVVLDEPLCPPPLDDLLEWVARRYAAPRGIAFARVVPPRVRIATGDRADSPGAAGPRVLEAYERGQDLLAAVRAGGASAWCVQCLPGEDRGALVSELVAAARTAGRSALVGVPEVHYGSRVLDALEDHWPGLARVDSARSDAERAESWRRMARGHGVGAGGRAVVFAPAPRLGVLVIDEEHNPTYKEDRSPRVDARRVALERTRLQGAACVFVSACPSVTLGGAVREGRVRFVEPRRAAARGARPVVELVERPSDGVLSPELADRMRRALRAGEPVALLTAARGYARSLWCAACRRSVRCPRCEAGVFFDAPSGARPARVRCGRCRWTATAPERCPACSERDFRLLGAGNERVAEQVGRAFPRARVRRMDPDVLEEGGDAAEPSDIYVTTWIGTKPALRPPATLVGVLDADRLIRRPDFRASENAYQALVEMAEWAGPAGTGGRLVVQTAEPGHHAVQAVVRADYRFFLERELPLREELAYPPFSELIKVTASGTGRAGLLERVAETARGAGARVLGPIPSGPPGDDDAAGELLLKCADAEEVAVALRGILASTPGGRLRVDVDPR